MRHDQGLHSDRVSPTYFSPNVKCSTYFPHLSNSLVGQILNDVSPAGQEGRERIKNIILTKKGSSIIGIRPTAFHEEHYKENQGNIFGKREYNVCPYYHATQKNCTIWRYRNSVCSTYFCKGHRREISQDFWRKLMRLLVNIEHGLSYWCASKLAISDEGLSYFFEDTGLLKQEISLQKWCKMDGTYEDFLLRETFGSWYGKEEEYYQQCGQLVENLSFAEVANILGRSSQISLGILQKAYAYMKNDTLGEAFSIENPLLFSTEEFDAEGMVSLQSLHLNSRHYLLLQKKDWESIQTVFDENISEVSLNKLKFDESLKLPEKVIKDLVDFKVLRPIPANSTWIDKANPDQFRVEKHDLLRVLFLEKASQEYLRDDNDNPVFCLTLANAELEFGGDEPELFHFGIYLAKQKLNFMAQDATNWVGKHQSPLPWEKVEEILEALLQRGLLEKLDGTG